MASSSAPAVESTTCTLSTGELPPVYSKWWHPEKTILDNLFGLLVDFLAGFGNVPEDEQDKEAETEYITPLRKKMSMMPEPKMKTWASLAKCNLVQTTMSIPSRDKLLQEWGLDDGKAEYELKQPDSNITLYITFPETILPDSITKPTEKDKEDPDLFKLLPKDIPVIIYFHGGGMTVGNADKMPEGPELVTAVLKEEYADVILVRVRYSLAPEHPFPVAPLEACSVVDYVLKLGFEKIHLAGVSAGGNLALVAGIEAHRQTGKIASILAACPMLGPACNTLSYYQNEASSHLCNVAWLRWCWRVYLEMKPSGDGNKDHKQQEGIAQNSNDLVWKGCKWNTATTMRRLIEPTIDLPKTFPKSLIVSTNTADPLHDDGVSFVKSLGANVKHHDHKGSHWFGTFVDKKGYRELVLDWREAIFGSEM